MKTDKIQSSIITPKTTGYTALAGMSAAILSGVSKNKSFRKTHKPFGCIAVIASLLHVGQIEYNRYKWNKSRGKT